MARVKRGVTSRKKVRATLERAKGYRGGRSKLYRQAHEQVLHSMRYATADRRAKKGDFRRLWVTRINAAAREHGLSYNRFINGLRLAEIEVDRRMLSELAVRDPNAFGALVQAAKAGLGKGDDAAAG